jgi:hypothetical protein
MGSTVEGALPKLPEGRQLSEAKIGNDEQATEVSMNNTVSAIINEVRATHHMQ